MVIGLHAGAARADVAKPDLAVYAAVEPVNRNDYEQQVRAGQPKTFFDQHQQQFRQIVAQAGQVGKPVRGNWMDQIDDADDWIKCCFTTRPA